VSAPMTAPRAIYLPSDVRAEIIAHARREAPNECCGLLIGIDGAIDASIAVRNVDDHPRRRFTVDPAAHIAVNRRLRNSGRAVVGCYHSHPASPARPSPSDVAEASYDGFVWLIVSLQEPAPTIAAFAIESGAVREICVNDLERVTVTL
jgi:desampylase